MRGESLECYKDENCSSLTEFRTRQDLGHLTFVDSQRSVEIYRQPMHSALFAGSTDPTAGTDKLIWMQRK